MINVGFIGAGNMGSAIMKGISNGLPDASPALNLFAYDPDINSAQRLKDYGVTTVNSENEIVDKCRYVFLAVKPQQLDSVLVKIKDSVTDETVLISICAGITEEYIKSRTRESTKVILAMPNTPLLLGEGATALAKVPPTEEGEFALVRDIFASVGMVAVIAADKMKEIIPVNGSSPAYIYLFAKAFAEYAESEGISADISIPLFAKTLIGSAKMLTESGKTIDELIRMVSSKGGTTVAGLEKLREGNFEETVKKACEACTKRAYELSN